MIAAHRLRELLATRPAGPNAEELPRWWRASGELLPDLLDDLDALDCDLVATRAALRREQDARAELRVELDRERVAFKTKVIQAESEIRSALVPVALVPVEALVEASIAMRHSESRAALASDVIAEVEAERALTDAQVETRTQAALTRWRTAVDGMIAAEGDEPRRCCPRFVWGDGTHDLSCRDAAATTEGARG